MDKSRIFPICWKSDRKIAIHFFHYWARWHLICNCSIHWSWTISSLGATKYYSHHHYLYLNSWWLHNILVTILIVLHSLFEPISQKHGICSFYSIGTCYSTHTDTFPIQLMMWQSLPPPSPPRVGTHSCSSLRQYFSCNFESPLIDYCVLYIKRVVVLIWMSI